MTDVVPGGSVDGSLDIERQRSLDEAEDILGSSGTRKITIQRPMMSMTT